jgi:hypothetical protein
MFVVLVRPLPPRSLPSADDDVWPSQGNDTDGWKPPQPWTVPQPTPGAVDEAVLPQMTVGGKDDDSWQAPVLWATDVPVVVPKEGEEPLTVVADVPALGSLALAGVGL